MGNKKSFWDFSHTPWFARLKNFIIGAGAAVVLVGALFKIMSWPGANEALQAGLWTEAGLFLMLGILPPHKDYYWEKLYPGLDEHHGDTIKSGASFDGSALTTTLDGLKNSIGNIKLDTSVLENQQKQMVSELQGMAKSMGALHALQGTDFNAINKVTQDAGKFAAQMNEAVSALINSIDDTKAYKEQLQQMNQNLQKMNGVYGNVLAAMGQK